MAPSNKALIISVNKRSFVVTLRIIIRLFETSFLKEKKKRTVEPPFATTSLKRPPLLSDHFSKIQRVFKFNYYRWNLSLATTSRKRPLIDMVFLSFQLFLTSRRRPLDTQSAEYLTDGNCKICNCNILFTAIQRTP